MEDPEQLMLRVIIASLVTRRTISGTLSLAGDRVHSKKERDITNTNTIIYSYTYMVRGTRTRTIFLKTLSFLISSKKRERRSPWKRKEKKTNEFRSI